LGLTQSELDEVGEGAHLVDRCAGPQNVDPIRIHSVLLHHQGRRKLHGVLYIAGILAFLVQRNDFGANGIRRHQAGIGARSRFIAGQLAAAKLGRQH